MLLLYKSLTTNLEAGLFGVLLADKKGTPRCRLGMHFWDFSVARYQIT